MLTANELDDELMRVSVVNSEYEDAIKECLNLENQEDKQYCIQSSIKEYKSAALNIKNEFQYKYLDVWWTIELFLILLAIVIGILIVNKKLFK